MITPEIISALAIGFFGSLHCIRMCGPIAIALPYPPTDAKYFILGRLFYNLGRLVTYSFIDAIFGLLGSRLIISGFQQVTTIFLGVIILIVTFAPNYYKNLVFDHRLVQFISLPLKQSISKLFKQGTIPSMFLIGLLNGFLPCGLVYVGIAGAISLGDAISGMVFMTLFGLGTFPTMLTATIFGKLLNLRIRNKFSKAVPYLASLLAILFILRGMSLGIPYISPEISAQNINQKEMECHPIK